MIADSPLGLRTTGGREDRRNASIDAMGMRSVGSDISGSIAHTTQVGSAQRQPVVLLKA